MKNFARVLLSVVAASAAIAGAFAAEFEEEENVLVLTDDNFDDAVKQFDPLLVEFYAPWCGHCKKLAPEYAAAAEELLESNLRIAKVDATENRQLADRFKVKGFPTLKFFRSGKPAEYNGGRTKDEIVGWVKRKSGPPAKNLATVQEAIEFRDSADVVAIAFLAETSEPARRAFNNAATEVEDVVFGVTSSDEVRAELGVEAGKDAVKVFKKFDGGSVETYAKKLTDRRALKDFFADNALPLVIPFSQQTSGRIFGGSIKTHLLTFINSDDEETADVEAVLRGVAKANKGRIMTITVDKNGDSRLFDHFGVKEEDIPTSILVNMPDGESLKKYKFTGSFGEAAVSKFVEDFFKGKLKAFLKSEPAPASNDGPVKVIVQSTFEEIALDAKKDVLVEFYAPWCGHCKQLAPIYEKVGAAFASNSGVVIAKVDSTANEIEYPGLNVQGFPTLYFFPAGADKEPRLFEGERTFDGIVSYIKKNAVNPVNDVVAADDHDEL